VVVDGRLIAKDFQTLFPGPRRGTWLAFSRHDAQLDWPAPAGWKDGEVSAVTLTDSGPGSRTTVRVKRGRLIVPLLAQQPLRLER
jgi:hypothetical protein